DLKRGITHVVHKANGKSVGSVERAWETLSGGKDSPHILRHTAASWAMKDGKDPKKMASYLGMSEATLLRRYGHLHADFHREVADFTGKGRANKTTRSK